MRLDRLDHAFHPALAAHQPLQSPGKLRAKLGLAHPALEDQNGTVATRLGRRGESQRVTRTQLGLRLGQPFQILRPDVAAVDDDQILGPPGHHDSTPDSIAEIAGIEPAVL